MGVHDSIDNSAACTRRARCCRSEASSQLLRERTNLSATERAAASTRGSSKSRAVTDCLTTTCVLLAKPQGALLLMSRISTIRHPNSGTNATLTQGPDYGCHGTRRTTIRCVRKKSAEKRAHHIALPAVSPHSPDAIFVRALGLRIDDRARIVPDLRHDPYARCRTHLSRQSSRRIHHHRRRLVLPLATG